jgi:hypothetical protein
MIPTISRFKVMSEDDPKRLPSASSWGRFEACHGSWQLEVEARRLGQVAHTASPSARSGTRIHAFLAGVADEDGKEIALTAEEQTTADFLQNRATEQARRIFGDTPVQQLDEKRLWLVTGGKRVASGQFDRCLYTNEVALVQDFKTGFVEPDPAETNAQLKVLAVLTALSLPTIKEVIVQIVSGPFGVTEGRYDLPALSDAYTGILGTLEAIGDKRAPLVPGVVQCRYCPAILICQAVKDTIKPLVSLQVSELPPDGERAARLLDEVDLLLVHLEEIKAWYKGRMAQDPNLRIPGYGLVPGNEVREISDWPKAREILRRHVPDRDLEGIPTLAQIQQALKSALKLPNPKAAAEKLNELLGDLIRLKQNAPSFKRISGEPLRKTLQRIGQERDEKT